MSGEISQRVMTCEELEGFLYAYLDGEFEPADKAEVERHLAQCPPCAQKFHLESAFRNTLHSKVKEHASGPYSRAPESLRRSIRTQLRHEQHRASLRSWARAGAAAAFIAAAGGAYVTLRPGMRGVYIEDAALRHAKSLPFEVQREGAEHLEAWFQGKLEHSVHVPTFPNTSLAGARLSHVKDKQAAYIGYDALGASGAGPRRIGLFVFQDSDREVPAQPLPSVELDSSHGYNVAIWRDHEIVYELVSDLDENDIRQMLASSNSLKRRSPLADPRPTGTTSPPVLQTPSLVQPASLQHSPGTR
jgi:mycothiol system anti-sigma-R factor